MFIDIPTLVLLQSINSFLQVVAMFLQMSVNRQRAGLTWWAWGSLSLALGFVFNLLRGNPLISQMAVVANNAFYITAMVLFYTGVMRFYGRRENRLALTMLAVAVTLIAAYFTYMDDNLAVRRVNISLPVAWVSWMIAYRMLRYSPLALRASTHMLTGVFGVFGAFFALRGISPFFVIPEESLFAATLTTTSSYVVLLIATTLWTYGFVVLVNQRANQAVLTSEERYRILFMDSPDAYLMLRDGVFVDCNRAALKMLGCERQRVVGKSPAQLSPEFQPDGQLSAAAAELKMSSAFQGGSTTFEWLHRRCDGTDLNVEISLALLDLQSQPTLFITWRDISERIRTLKALQQQSVELERSNLQLEHVLTQANAMTAQALEAHNVLQMSENRMNLLLQSTDQGIYGIDGQGCCTFINQAALRMLGYEQDECLGQNMHTLIHHTHQDGRPYPESECPIFQSKREGAGRYIENEVLWRKDGSMFSVVYSAHPLLEDGEILGSVVTFSDITERLRLQQLLEKQATTDALTELINRRRFIELSKNEIKRSIRQKSSLTIAQFDIDYFKSINDRFGHAGGDTALKLLSQVCQKNIRDLDLLARFGGDEFAMLLPMTGPEQADVVIRRLFEQLAVTPLQLGDQTVYLTLSAGLTCLGNREESLDELLERADRALYQAKQAGRNRFVFISPLD